MESFQTKIRKVIKFSLLLGYYLIWLLLDPSKFKKIKKEEIKKILIVHLGAVGELLFTTPMFPILKKALNCDISLMVSKGKERIFENNPYVSEVLTYQEDFKENVSLLKKKNFDLALIIYPGSTKISLMCFFAKIKYRVAYSNGFKDGPALFLTRKFFFLTKKHAIEKTFGVLEQINILDKNTKLEFYLSKKEKENLRKKLTSLKIKDYMIVHPSFSSVTQSNYPSRLWPLDRYAEITDYLIEKYKVKVFLTGMPNEKMISEKIKELAKNKKEIIVANELFELRELATLISNAKLLVSCGTGIVQIATAFDAPIVLFEGKGDSFETIPQNSKKYYRFLHHPEVCVGCEKESCRKKTIECMKAITVNEVKNAINEIIKENYS